MKEKTKKILWFLVFVALVIVTICAIIGQTEDFTLRGFLSFIKNASWGWVALALVSMTGFFVFEGLALYVLCRDFGYKQKKTRAIGYASLDVYFSAITPSATGGQPASAYYMMKDKIPGAITTIILLVNLTLYTITIIIIGMVCFVTRIDIFMQFTTVSKILITFGFVFQFILISIFVLLVYKEKLVMRIASGTMSILNKLHLMKHVEEKQKRLVEVEKQYKECAAAIMSHKKTLIIALIFNILQRLSQIMVTVFVFLATGGTFSKVYDVFITRGYCVLGANCVPIPGAVGVSDYLFLDGLEGLVSDPTNVELFSQGISFYSCILICGIISLVIYINESLKGMKQKKNDRIL